MQNLEAELKEYLLQEFLPGEDPANLTDTTPLVTGGILDSIATLKLVSYLEETYDVRFQAHEVDAENLDTIADIAKLVRTKQGN